jgi:hypothetical protein
MGTEIRKEEFDELDFTRFRERLEQCLTELGQLLERPGFGAGPVRLAGSPFAALGEELGTLLDRVGGAVGVRGGRLALIGILPTLRRADLHPGSMTDLARYPRAEPGPATVRQLAHISRPPAVGGDQDRAVQAISGRSREPRTAPPRFPDDPGDGMAARRGAGAVHRERPAVPAAAAGPL